ncbi:MAG TPA: hypothetical protein VIV57_13610 [Anaeromyxobacter sp.]
MKKRLALLLSLLAAAGCTAQNNASVKFAGMCLPPDDPTTCTFSATCSGQFIGQSTVDVGVTNKFWAVIQVDNQMPNNENLSNFRTNTNDAYVQEFEVEYSGAPLPITTGPVLGSGVVPAAGSTVISVLPVPEIVGTVLQGSVGLGGAIDIVAKMRLRGVYGDTTKFETGVFEFPLRVCNGCVGSFQTGCALPDIAFICPPNDGQLPVSAQCTTP